MLRDKYELQLKLQKRLYKVGNTKENFDEFRDRLIQKYNLPVDIISDIVSGRKSLSSFNELENYWFCNELDKTLVPEFFTDREVRQFKGLKYIKKDPVLPINVPAHEVRYDQWIGILKIADLMKLRDAGLIRYNADTQRALQVMIRGEEITYKPFVNQTAVQKIYNLIKDGDFIPNTITLNLIPYEGDEKPFDYDHKNKIMCINRLRCIDIVDGYHRLKAFERVYDEDHSFDMTIEVRLIAFDESRAKQFIHQEDQKTKMRRIDSAGYDQRNECNLLLQEINQGYDIPELHGKINMKEGLVRLGVASKALSRVLPKKKWTSIQKIKFKNLLTQHLRQTIYDNPELKDERWTDEQIMGIFGGISVPQEGGEKV